MKREKLRKNTAFLPLSLAAATVAITHTAPAATATWLGSNRVLATNAYWANSTPPGAGDEAYFGTVELSGGVPLSLGFKGTGTTPPIINLTWASVVFDCSAITASGPLHIESSLSTTNTGAASLTLNGDGNPNDDIIELTNNVTGEVDFAGGGATAGFPLTMTPGVGAMDVENPAAILHIDAVVAGSSGINKVGPGTLYLNNAPTGTSPIISTFTGGVTINAGIVAIDDGQALGDPNNTTTINNGTLEFQTTTAGMTATLVATQSISLGSASSSIDVMGGNTLFVLGSITGTGALNKIDAGTLVLTGANSYSGGTNISGGALQVGQATDTAPLASPLGTGPVTNSTSLFFSSSQATAIGDAIGGGGSVTQNGSGITTLSAANSYSGGTNVSAGTLVVGATGALSNGPVNITGGTLQLAASTGLATISSLAISGNGTFDVNNNHVIINYGSGSDPIASIATLLATGYNGGAWNGLNGIISTAAQLNNATPGNLLYGVGYADSADTGNPAGLASGTIEIAYALLGDANLSGVVDGTDFGIVAANFNKGVTGWDQGDFNYDNVVDGTDFGDLAANFNKGASNAAAWQAVEAFAAANGLLADVPEPASLGMLTLGAAAILARRRRKDSDVSP